MGWFWGKRFHFGTRTDDRITGSSRSDIVFGFGGDDEISTRGGRDKIFAGHGDDTIHAGAGNDFVAAGRGDDLIFDGAGSDTVKSGHGDDTVVFVSRDNIGYHDRFDGGRGQDTLRLELTSQDWTADVREEVQAFLEFVAANTRTNGDTNGRGFTFDTLGLTVRRFEKIEVLVDGVLVDPTGDGNTPPTVGEALTASIAEDSAAVILSLLEGAEDADQDPLNVEDLVLLSGDDTGISLSSDGNSLLVDPSTYQRLAAGQTEVVDYSYLVSDGNGGTVAQTVTITITGTNDAATISGERSGAVEEDGTLRASGGLTVADVDSGESGFVAQEGTAGTFGTFDITADGAWTYALDTTNAEVQALGAGATRSERFDVVSRDGTAVETVTITITGANDAATISGLRPLSVQEDGLLSDSATVTVTDPDQGEAALIGGTIAGAFGSFTVTSDGTVTYDLDNDLPPVQALGAGESLTDSATISTVDGQTARVTAEILGRDETPVDPVSASLRLTDDTGRATDDGITSTFAFDGTLSGLGQVTRARLEISTDTGLVMVDILPLVAPSGSFNVGEAAIEAAFADAGATLDDGFHQANVTLFTSDGSIVQSDFVTVVLDRTAASVVSAPQGADFADRAPDRLFLSFDEAIDPLSLDVSDIVLTDDAGARIMVGSVVANGANGLQVNLAQTLDNGAYQLSITGDGVADNAGNRTTTETPVDFAVSAPTRIVSIAPSDDTDLVNLDRKISIQFDRPVDPRTITSESFQILAPDGAQIEGALRLSSDGLKASFFLAEGTLLPASSTVRILIDGTQILDTAGQPVDADGDGIAGGTRITDFETVSVTPVPDTNIEGFIFDSNRRGPDGEDIPLEGVVVSVVGLPGVFAVTDETGRFFLEDLPVPDAFLEFDATAVEAESGFRYGAVTKPVHTIAGQTTQMALADGTPFNIYLASLSTSDAVPINTAGETTVRLGADGLANLAGLFPEVDPAQWENLTVTIPENSLFFDDGTPATEVTILAFQPDRIPAPLPQGYDPDFVFTLVAGGAENFDSNAQVTFPNLDDLPPGARRPILSFDHDAGEWVQTGTAVVSADGSVLTTEGEGGVNTLGWKFLGPTAISQHTEGPTSGPPPGGGGTPPVPPNITPSNIGLPDNRLNGLTEAGEEVVNGIRNFTASQIQAGLAVVAVGDAIAPTEAAPNPVDAAVAGLQTTLGLTATGLDPDSEITPLTIADAGVSTAASLTPGVDTLFNVKGALQNGRDAIQNLTDARDNFTGFLGDVVYAATADSPSEVFGDRARDIAANGPVGPSANDINRALNPDAFPDAPSPEPQNLRSFSGDLAAPLGFSSLSVVSLSEDNVLLPLVEDTILAAQEQIIEQGRLANLNGVQMLQSFLIRDGQRISAGLDPDSPARQAVTDALDAIAGIVPAFDRAIADAADAFRMSVSMVDTEMLGVEASIAAFQEAQNAYAAQIGAAFATFNADYATLTTEVDAAITRTFNETNGTVLDLFDQLAAAVEFYDRQIAIIDDYAALVEQLGSLDGSQQGLLDLEANAKALLADITAFLDDLGLAGAASITSLSAALADQSKRVTDQIDLALTPFVDSFNPLFAQAILDDGTVLRARLAPGEEFSINGPVGTDAVIRFFDPATNLFSERTITFGEDNTTGRSVLSIVLTEDRDGDGIPDLGEEVIGTDPDSADSDGDGTLDGVEIRTGAVSANDPGTLPTGIIGSVALEGAARDVAVIPTAGAPGQNFALVAAGTGGLAIVDVGQATAPSLVRQIALPGEAVSLDVDAAAGLALIAGGAAGLHVVDVGTPSAPLLLRTIDGLGPVSTVTALGGLAIVGGATSLAVIDPGTGAILSNVAIDAPFRDVNIDDIEVVGDIVYVIERGARNDIAADRFEVSATLVAYRLDAGSLIELDRLDLPVPVERKIEPEPFKLFVDGGTAYVSNGLEVTDISDFRPLERGGYLTVSVADAEDLSLISDIDTGDVQAANFETVTNGAGLVVTAAGSFGIQLFDAGDPGNTFDPLTVFDTPGNALGVVMSGGLAYVADGAGGLQIVNLVSEGPGNTAPVVTISLADRVDIDPDTASVQVAEGSVIPVDLTLTDDGQINRIDVIVDGEIQSTLLSPPFSPLVLAPTLAKGETAREMTIELLATDAGGLSGRSMILTVEVVADTVGPQIVTFGVSEGQTFVPDRATTIEVVFDSLVLAETVSPGLLSVSPALGGTAIPAQSVTLQSRTDGTTTAIFVIDGLPTGDYVIEFDPSGVSDRNGNLSPETVIARSAVVEPFTNIWTATGDGDWSDSTNWSADALPGFADRVLVDTASGATAAITSAVAPIDSLLNQGFGRLDIDATGFGTVFEAQNLDNDGVFSLRDGRVEIARGFSNGALFEVLGDGRLEFTGTNLVNTGTLRIGEGMFGSGSSGNGSIDLEGGSVFLTGGGTVAFDADQTGFAGNITGISDPNSQTFTNVDNTITGTGTIGPDFGFVNGADGVLRAGAGDRLVVAVSMFENDGLVIAEAGGEVAIDSRQFLGSPFAFRTSGTLDNFDGVLHADGGLIDLSDTLVRGGTIRTSDQGGQAGLIRVGNPDNGLDGGFAGFEGFLGQVEAEANIDVVADINITGNFNNSGVMRIADSATVSAGSFFFDFQLMQIGGGGTIEMQSDPLLGARAALRVGANITEELPEGEVDEGSFFDTTFLVDMGSILLRDHTIRGAGLVGIEDVPLYLEEELGFSDLFPEQFLDRTILENPDFSGDLFEARITSLINLTILEESRIVADRPGEALTLANASVFSLGEMSAVGGTLEFINSDVQNRGQMTATEGGSIVVSVIDSFFNAESFFNQGTITIDGGDFETDLAVLSIGDISILDGSATFRNGIDMFEDFDSGLLPEFKIGDADVEVAGAVNANTTMDLGAGAASVSLLDAGQFAGAFRSFTEDDVIIFREFASAASVTLTGQVSGQDIVLELDDGVTLFSTRIADAAFQVVSEVSDLFVLNDTADGEVVLTTLLQDPFL
ncbi:VCBS domain-containing protein [Roseovarius mucosus]|nr:VCBS domain-containing protein [Roseovarius mucosus]